MSSSLVFKPPKRINLKKPSNNQLVIENKNNKPTYIYLYSLLNKELIDLNKN